jgi:hypothetical protein
LDVKYGGMEVTDVKRLKALEIEISRDALRKKMVTASARRELVR